jgi:hypothetical protein
MAGKPQTWPEHEKLKAISEFSQKVHDFLEWCSEKGWELAQWEGDRMFPIRPGRDKILADFFEIDMDKIEAEKRAMLDLMRAQNGLDEKGHEKEDEQKKRYDPFCDSANAEEDEENDRDVMEMADNVE